MMGEASLVLDSLECQEREIKYFQMEMGQAKRIKCPYCEHRGKSNLEESTPVYVYLLCFVIYLVIGFFSVLIYPCIVGIFRDQRHRCPKCHNEIKEDSIFSSLDDKIMTFNVGTFGVLVTRRTLIKMLMFLVCVGLATLAWDVVVEGPTWYLEGRQADKNLIWVDFVKDCGLNNNRQTIISSFE